MPIDDIVDKSNKMELKSSRKHSTRDKLVIKIKEYSEGVTTSCN